MLSFARETVLTNMLTYLLKHHEVMDANITLAANYEYDLNKCTIQTQQYDLIYH